MNASTAARIADAITLERNARALERARGADHQNRGNAGGPSGQNQLPRTSSAGPDLRGGRISGIEIGRRSGDAAIDIEGEAMKRRLLIHMMWAVAIVLAFMAWHVVTRM